MSPDLQALLVNTLLPALAAFAIAHFHILLPAPKPNTPVPVPAPVPVNPANIRPIGQGGLIDVAAIFLAQILASSANQNDKITAGTKVFEASQLVAGPHA